LINFVVPKGQFYKFKKSSRERKFEFKLILGQAHHPPASPLSQRCVRAAGKCLPRTHVRYYPTSHWSPRRPGVAGRRGSNATPPSPGYKSHSPRRCLPLLLLHFFPIAVDQNRAPTCFDLPVSPPRRHIASTRRAVRTSPPPHHLSQV
jgi:hypothetical protein